MVERRLKALVIAEAANPEWVSVPLVGWSLANALRRVADVHIVTQVRNREAILRAGLIEGRDFTAIDSEKLAAPMWRLAERLSMGKGVGWTIKTAISTLGYGYFERLVWRAFGPQIRAGAYDIVHRVTPLTPTANSLLAPRCRQAGVPFVLGPLNGGVPWPKGFDSERQREKEWLSYVRGAYRALPGRGAMLRDASAIICGSLHTRNEIPARHHSKAVWLPENAIDPARFSLTAPQPGTLPLRGCFIGRLVPYKGADMAIEAALPLLRAGKLVLDIVGDGPQAGALRDLVAREGAGQAVRFHGWLAHEEVQGVAARAQLLVFPSVREFGGGVVLEAMALGVVPVVADYAGPGELVDDATGLRIPMGSRAELVAELRRQLQAIAADPSVLPGMAARAQARVMRDFTWDAKAAQVERIWRAVLAGTPLPQELSPPGRTGIASAPMPC
ncbi:glycosyltransferase family 4 protein [Paracoccus sp. J56]|uniref:glycosyltransferase family 4 protein n=1 Tax=Paracoccus sp. J56 TaxID=935850 RepID=UPI000A0C5551|nr:glycosyltransferase family 4 protein [Paracoccus sp. J56]SMG44162.1 Glycosyltransferase involved in cell wall bisynthesis [Paracoccus sp. J56]